ncbi:hypothetical protein JCM3770_003624, partial [Rhodotorula araucariae]
MTILQLRLPVAPLAEPPEPGAHWEANFCLAEDLVAWLKPIANLTAAVSEAKAVRISNIICWIDLLSAAFEKILHSPVEYPAVLHNAALCSFKQLQKYYVYTDDDKFYRLGL